MYVCFNCQKRVEMKDANTEVTCPSCSCRVFFKETPEIKKTVVCR